MATSMRAALLLAALAASSPPSPAQQVSRGVATRSITRSYIESWEDKNRNGRFDPDHLALVRERAAEAVVTAYEHREPVCPEATSVEIEEDDLVGDTRPPFTGEENSVGPGAGAAVYEAPARLIRDRK